jgi:hypothetical protein
MCRNDICDKTVVPGRAIIRGNHILNLGGKESRRKDKLSGRRPDCQYNAASSTDCSLSQSYERRNTVTAPDHQEIAGDCAEAKAAAERSKAV